MIEAAADLQLISASVSTVAVLQLTTVVVHLSFFLRLLRLERCYDNVIPNAAFVETVHNYPHWFS